MSTNEEEVVSIDLSKMKVNELKKELQSRNLKVTGNKQDLIDRLQTYLEEHEGAEVAEEDDILKDDDGDSILSDEKKIEDPEPEPSQDAKPTLEIEQEENEKDKTTESTEEKVLPLKRSEISDAEKKAVRAQKFGLDVKDLSTTDRKKARQQRFGLGGGNVNSDPDKLKRRAERFGASETEANAKPTSVNEEKKKLRLEKFGSVSAPPMDEKKKKRAERFGVSVA